ncbi:MAG: polyprenyl synthetase family protein [Candidatus Nitrosocaldaceae archaeon]
MVQISIIEEIKRVAKIVDDYIIANVKSDSDILEKASLHYIVNGGKRLRPFLTITSNALFNGKMDIILPLAAALEITHNFTLIHDDIMDNDESRHGVVTVHKAYGLPAAILAGDLLIVKAFHLIVESNKAGLDENKALRIIENLAKTCIDISEGQMEDISLANDKTFSSMNYYIKMISKKTGVLFKAACEIGALAGDANEDDIKNLADYGMNIGIAFQLIDDLIGVAGDPSLTKKPVGNDIREGKKTLPILLAMNKVNENERREILQVFGKKDAKNEEINNVVNIIVNSGIDTQVRKEARRYMDIALHSISKYDSRAYPLRVLAEFVVERKL